MAKKIKVTVDSQKGIVQQSLGSDDEQSGFVIGSDMPLIIASSSITYQPVNVLDWSTVPTNINEALDILAADVASGGGGGGGADVSGSYIVAGLTGSLSNERALSGSNGQISITDGGANGNIVVGLVNTTVTPASYTNANITVDAQGRITAAASGLLGYFEPRAKPASPHALDDEFDATSTLTLWNPAGVAGVTQATANSMLTVMMPAASPANPIGVYKEMPSTNSRSAWACVASNRGDNSQQNNPGIALFEALPAGNVKYIMFFANQTAGNPSQTGLYVQTYLTHGAFVATLINDVKTTFGGSHWFRVRYIDSSTSLFLDYCTDGINWNCLYNTTSPYVKPNYIALISTPHQACTVRSDFLRFSESATYSDVTLGKAV